MKITSVRATWLRAPIPAEHAHVSDGRNDAFNVGLVEIETDTGITGLGEAKAVVGNLGNSIPFAAPATTPRRSEVRFLAPLRDGPPEELSRRLTP
jgi:L-alanine-DL-glutamate epimerase-like enolase superfamily enzyme